MINRVAEADVLTIEQVSKTFNIGTVNEKRALDDVSLHLAEGEFLTIIGGNGAGKSTLMNAIAGVYPVDSGSIRVGGVDVTRQPEYRRAAYIGRVFQDPMMGTAANMGIEENLALAYRRGRRRGLRWGIGHREQARYRELLATLELGLEDRLSTRVGLLSGGQRQALTLLMATLQRPQLLMLDEHTAALDPRTAARVLELSRELITANNLTTIMITHNMRDAIAFGNRLVMMYEGRMIIDIRGEEKRRLTVSDLLTRFEQSSGSDEADDTLLLA
jgi:putative ABC transport system ATP-binding protein